MKEYKSASLDKYGILVTSVLGIACIVIGFISIFYEVNNLFGLASILAILLLIGISFIPKIYIENKVLTIKNLFSKTEIPLSKIDKVAKVDDKPSIRSFGIGGVFGYFGRFNGNEKWFVTNRKNIVKIKTKEGKIYALSPEDKNQFLMDIQYQNIKPN